jgi:hypothetical protein
MFSLGCLQVRYYSPHLEVAGLCLGLNSASSSSSSTVVAVSWPSVAKGGGLYLLLMLTCKLFCCTAARIPSNLSARGKETLAEYACQVWRETHDVSQDWKLLQSAQTRTLQDGQHDARRQVRDSPRGNIPIFWPLSVT